MTTDLRVLIIAEAANPEWVSVPLVGWSLSAALQRKVNAHLVTQVRNREAILRTGLIEGVDFTAIDSEAVERWVWRLSSNLRMGGGAGWTTATAFAALSYPYFEKLVWRRFGPDIEAGRFDLVHRITPLSPTAPSPIAVKCKNAGTPFVLGPLNGGAPWPPGFGRERRREREWLSYARGVYKLFRSRKATLDAADAILVGSCHTLSEMPERVRPKCIHLPENAVDPERFRRRAIQSGEGSLRACFIGRLVPYKGPDMLIEAAAPLLRDGALTLDIIGDGPLMPELRALAARESIEKMVTFHGWLDHTRVQDVAAECQVLPFPSIREFGGGVVLEAMALGLVPIVVDYAGPGELVDETCGIKVPLGTREEIVAGFREVLYRLSSDRSTLPVLANNGLNAVERDYTWSRKADKVIDVYREILARRDSADNF